MAHPFSRPPLARHERAALTARIAALEARSAGELRLVLQRRRAGKEREVPLMTLALGHFRRLGMDQTAGATGVLLFVLLEERRLQIVADAGIYAKLPQAGWDALAAEGARAIGAFGLCAGLEMLIDKIAAPLAAHFPRDAGDRNELPDAPVMR